MNALRFLFVAYILLSMTGCGGCGGPSQSALRRAAARKRSDGDTPAVAPKPPDTSRGEGAKGAPGASADGKPAALSQPQNNKSQEEPIKTIASNEKPSEALTETERRARSIANLEKIGRALVAYEKNHGYLPQAASDRDGDLLVSWRVLILAELGYPELLARFKLDEPWSSKANILLVDYIPPEYQSPERFDNKTNYLAVVGQNGAFEYTSRRYFSTIKDGVDNTLAIVEVDDKSAA